MAWIRTSGLWINPLPFGLTVAPSATTATIDATGEKLAFIGRVWNKDGTTKSIEKVGFRFGAVTKAGGSALTVSLQDVDLTTGPVVQPDGTPDQSVAIANANAAFLANTFILTGSLSANRSVAFGEMLAVVVEFDGAGRLGADTVGIIAGLAGAAGSVGHQTTSLLTASWAQQNVLPGILLGFSDGTYGGFDGGFPSSNTSNSTLNSGSGTDEIGLYFTLPYNCKIDAAYMITGYNSSSANADIVLYNAAGAAVATVSQDGNAVGATSTPRPQVVTFPEVQYTANEAWRLAFKPTTANNVTLTRQFMPVAAYFQAFPGFSTWQGTSRADAGAWTEDDTVRPIAGIRISAIQHGVDPTFALGI